MTESANSNGSSDFYLTSPNRAIEAGDGVSYAYRETGPADAPPMLLLVHFRGNLDNWDPERCPTSASPQQALAWGKATPAVCVGEQVRHQCRVLGCAAAFTGIPSLCGGRLNVLGELADVRGGHIGNGSGPPSAD